MSDTNLPRATVQKVIKDAIPSKMRISQDVKDIVVNGSSDFVNLLAAKANELCLQEFKKTIAPYHVFDALIELGYSDYVDKCKESLEQYKQHELTRPKKKTTKLVGNPQDLLEEQRKMFEEAAKSSAMASSQPLPVLSAASLETKSDDEDDEFADI
ncbi:hypothetical protein GEMRC1_006660 [Eukaryota sp. GEM-RC1]